MTRISPEQRAAIEAHPRQPVAVEDEYSHERFYLVPEASFLHMQGLLSGQEQDCRDRLRRLIQEGIDSPDVSAAEAWSRLRRLEPSQSV